MDDRDAALDMARKGIATLAEIARLIGTTRQLVRYWCEFDNVNAPKARSEYLTKEWNKRVGEKSLCPVCGEDMSIRPGTIFRCDRNPCAYWRIGG